MSGYSRTSANGDVEKKPPFKVDWKKVKLAFQIVTLVLVVLAVVVVGISLFRPSSADNITRFCFEATPGQVVGGTGEAGGWFEGSFELDTESNLMKLYADFPLTMSQITSIVIMGPRLHGEKNGPEYFSICGAPNLVNVCDVLTTPGHVEQTVTQLQPGAEDNRPAILAIRAQPTPNYYIEVRTALFPNSPGALRAPLSSICGFP
jgi:hypothetical protein